MLKQSETQEKLQPEVLRAILGLLIPDLMLAMLVVQGVASRNKRAAQLLVLCLHPFLASLAFLKKKLAVWFERA